MFSTGLKSLVEIVIGHNLDRIITLKRDMLISTRLSLQHYYDPNIILWPRDRKISNNALLGCVIVDGTLNMFEVKVEKSLILMRGF